MGVKSLVQGLHAAATAVPCHRICHTINKIVHPQHLLLLFEELLSLRLSDPFALVVG